MSATEKSPRANIRGQQVSTYGKCILADYQSVHKDMCAKEFARLKDCYLVSFCSPISPALSGRAENQDGPSNYADLDGLTETCEEEMSSTK